MGDDTDSEVNALLASAQKLRQQAQEAGALPWYRRRMLKLARDIEAKAIELEKHGGKPSEQKKKGPDNVRPFRQS